MTQFRYKLCYFKMVVSLSEYFTDAAISGLHSGELACKNAGESL